MLVGYEMIIATIISYTMHDREIIVKVGSNVANRIAAFVIKR